MNINIKGRPSYRKKKLPKSKPMAKFRITLKSCSTSVFGALRFLKAYARHSNIHGVCYLAKDELTWFERFFWSALVIICLISSILIGLKSVDRFQTKSTVIGLESDYSYWNTTLPGLTVCPMRRLNIKLFDKLCNIYSITGKRKDEFFDFLEILANTTYATFDQIPQYESVDQTLKDLGVQPERYMELIYNLTVDVTLAGHVNAIDGESIIFARQILTEFGLCYLTNTYLGPDYSSRYMIFGDHPEVTILDKKRRHLQVKTGMSLEMNVEYSITNFSNEIGVYIHSAYETMRLGSGFIPTEFGVEIESIMTEIIAAEGLEKAATVAQRKCRFQHESNLTHFPIYTRNMCIQECRLNMAMELCNCIPHFYPNRIGQPKPVCEYKVLISCLSQHKDFLLKLNTQNGEHNRKDVPCHCLPNCQDAFVSITKTIHKSDSMFTGTTVTIKARTWPHNRLKRQMVFSFMDLLVSIGGAAGLFLGFSVLGAMEIIYFFTLRLLCHLCGHKYH